MRALAAAIGRWLLRWSGENRYGDNRTIHRTGHVDVGLDSKGRVVEVWFRCSALPFRVHQSTDQRAEEMLAMYSRYMPPPIRAIVFEEKR